ncbi:hypothetical protein GCM10009119_35470 [Algoriphagus jejuensis]|uniref:Helix-turn-helix type 11 domain-containing protein n=1 Tax=Algoriphagus jejuensis TaxID=419934 RepID=A0ABP3YKG9_9BACT
MEFIRQIERLQLLNKLVKERRTGSPEELAERLGIGRRQLYVYIEYLKDFGMDIQFSRKLDGFVYAEQHELKIEVRFELLDSKSRTEINGGESLNLYTPCYFYALTEDSLVI